MQHKCGVIGIYTQDRNIANDILYALYALQHRGQEAAGMSVSDGVYITSHRGLGLVSNVFTPGIMDKIDGNIGVGHVRYSTSGNGNTNHTQPLSNGIFHLVFNGTIVNFKSDDPEYNDTDYIMDYLSKGKIEDRLRTLIIEIKGAYSIIVLTSDTLYACRDRYGFRPLVLGHDSSGYAIASETCALDIINMGFDVTDVKPGELIRIRCSKLSRWQVAPSDKRECVFELMYFSRPDSKYDSKYINDHRRELGEQLAKEETLKFNNDGAVVVVPVPDGGTCAAAGYAQESDLPLIEGLMRNRYINRSFIKPTNKSRQDTIRVKYNVYKSNIENKEIILVDDSICRGNTMKYIVELLRESKPRKIHVRIASPPVVSPCYMGIDMPTHEELIANQRNVDEICKHIGADSLAYLSLDGVGRALGDEGFCMACFNGEYPIELEW